MFCHHDVVHLPIRDSQSLRRPSTSSTYHTRSVLPRIQIMGSPDAKTPFRLHQVLPPTITYQAVKEDPPGPIQLPSLLCTHSLLSRPPNHHTRGCGYRRLGSYLLPCREFIRERPWVGR